VTPDLFGNIVLIRIWGRIGTAGKQRDDLHPDFASAGASLEWLSGKKRRRGYVDGSFCRDTAPNSARPYADAAASVSGRPKPGRNARQRTFSSGADYFL
jgi:predicted DNA-binding WGR domain protein